MKLSGKRRWRSGGLAKAQPLNSGESAKRCASKLVLDSPVTGDCRLLSHTQLLAE